MEKDYSLSLNYYQYAEDKAQIDLGGYGPDALNDFGKSVYNSGKNPYFGLLCGDSYVNNYDQGAMLIMSLNLNFNSRDQKDEFEAHAKASFGNIFSASGDVQSIATQYNIQGSAIIQAYQKGGDPSQLAKILSKDPSGAYYILTCSLESMDNCIKAASGLLDYAHDNFPTQFSFTEEKGLTTLGTGFAKYVPIRYIGLIPAQSFVTPQVLQERIDLFNELNKYNYYEEKLKELLYGYPATWDTTSDLYKNIQKLYQQAQENVNTILSPQNPDLGGAGCFDTPDKCESIAEDIKSKIVPINDADLAFLEEIKYIMPTDYNDGYYGISATFYKTGDLDQWSNGTPSIQTVSFHMSNTTLTFDIKYQTYDCIRIVFNGGTSKDGLTYIGSLNVIEWKNGENGHCGSVGTPAWTFNKQPSSYYFTPWNETSSNS